MSTVKECMRVLKGSNSLGSKLQLIELEIDSSYGVGTARQFVYCAKHYDMFEEDISYTIPEELSDVWNEIKRQIDGQRNRTSNFDEEPPYEADYPEEDAPLSLEECASIDPSKLCYQFPTPVSPEEQAAHPERKYYVSDVIDMHELQYGKLNLIYAPPGSGKTTFIEGELKRYAEGFSQNLLYLAPTRGLVDSVNFRGTRRMHVLPNGRYYYKWEQDGITAMTYAAFGSQIQREKINGTYCGHEWWETDSLICLDELSDAVKYAYFPGDQNLVELALEELVKRTKNESNMVVTIGATPKNAVNFFHFWKNADLKVIKSTVNLKGYENREVIEYSELDNILKSLDPKKRGMVFAKQIRQVQHIVDVLNSRGIQSVGIWSKGNEGHPMTGEQIRAADSLIAEERLPDDVQVLVFNAAYETGLNIKPEKSHLDYAVIHNTNKDTIVQARGRYRGDIDTLYVKRKKSDVDDISNREIDPDTVKPYLDIRLLKADKDRLREELGFKDGGNRLLGWSKIAEILRANGYTVTNKKSGSKRYSTIALP